MEEHIANHGDTHQLQPLPIDRLDSTLCVVVVSKFVTLLELVLSKVPSGVQTLPVFEEIPQMVV